MGKDIKIYHVETQEDYNDLMVKLEKQGYKWMSGDKPTIKPQYWDKQRENTAIVLDGFDEHHIARGSISWCKGIYSNAPVIKHKAKGVEQMEKVIVPKFVADWYEKYKRSHTLYGLMGLINGYNLVDDEKLFKWKMNCGGRYTNSWYNAQEVIAKMHLYGYEVEVEEEKKYYWRKKKEHTFDFEGDDDIYLNIHIGTGEPFFRNIFDNVFFQALLTETEAKQAVTEEDFNKLERVEADV